ncbi:MAG TPA: glycosyltransferase [Candidatus Saccharimonadales bacterium]|nr:glycosyltransferase [Candidatus Saccharimonadales bacterium]
MSVEEIKTCLVISYGPVPTPQYQTVEGGGMRAWGLAQGLKRNGVDVTIGINNSFPQEHTEHEGIKLTNWGLDDQFKDLINTYDAVIISYCMGNDSVFVAENIDPSVLLILDAYVPIYVEVSARESADIDTEYRNYMADIQRFNEVLRRGDYFLCASEKQKTFYVGVLSSLGIINPRSYREDRIIIAPFGIHDTPAVSHKNPYLDLGIKKDDFVVMWFGGLYPWFRIEELLGSILELSKQKDFKFVIVGGKNPFNPNPDFSRQYDKALAFAKEHNLFNKSMFFVDWVDFEDRINYYIHANIVVSLNQEGEENGFSWRTRVMDFVWGELAILTNGGDPLSEDLLAEDAALRLDSLSSDAITAMLKKAHGDRKMLATIKKRIIALKPRYYWTNLTKPIARIINEKHRPFKEEREYRAALHIPSEQTLQAAAATPPSGSGPIHQAKRVVRLSGRVIRYARRKGLRRSGELALQIAKTQTRERLTKRERRFVFISHPIDNTGAPVVLVQIIREYAAKYGAKNIHVVTPHITKNHLRSLREMGIKVDKAAVALSPRMIKMQLNLRKDDFVLMNTIAIYDNYRDFVLSELESGKLAHAYWFIHEDKAQIPGINRDFVQKRNINRIRKLADKQKLTIAVPSKRTQKEYHVILGTKRIQTIPLLVDVPKKFCGERKVSDYNKLRFFISGTPADGRKGQLIALSAFQDFLLRYYQKNPKNYRDFSLTLLAIGDDYISQQIKWIGDSTLGKHVDIHSPMPREDALAIMAKSNVVMCCSLNETFGLYVAEGMFMGCVVLRNDAAGVDEQLKEGVNGYAIDHTNIPAMAEVLEKILNKKITSDESLQDMGAASQQIIGEYGKNDYLEKIEALN